MQNFTKSLQTDKLTLKNRLVMAPLATSKSNEDETAQLPSLFHFKTESLSICIEISHEMA